jgi:hypothetical protein
MATTIAVLLVIVVVVVVLTALFPPVLEFVAACREEPAPSFCTDPPETGILPILPLLGAITLLFLLVGGLLRLAETVRRRRARRDEP